MEDGLPTSRPTSRQDVARRYRSLTGSDCCACSALAVIILLVLAAIGGISYAIILGIEQDLTGEGFGAKGHTDLFRICESADTSSNTFHVHTCNVYSPNSDPYAPPKHAFTEGVRNWYPAGSPVGDATLVKSVSLERLLTSVNLQCEITDPTVMSRNKRAQIIIGGVGQGFRFFPYATACNYRSDGTNLQNHCGFYGDGGDPASNTAHPLSINQIFEKHFGRGNCSFVV